MLTLDEKAFRNFIKIFFELLALFHVIRHLIESAFLQPHTDDVDNFTIK